MNIDAPDRSDIASLRALWREAFGDSDAFMDIFFEGAAFSPERCKRLKVDGSLAAALYWFDCTLRGERVAYLYAIATSERYRGRGLCSALMNNTHEYLGALGYKGAVLVPSNETLFDFYRKRGYETCGYVSELECAACGEAIDLRAIDTDEYARQRRAYLPSGGVIQENENLGFLAAQYELFAGDGLLLAARRNKDTLVCAELLGDVTMASAILKTLGCTSGSFRTIGNGKPFAMYMPLDGGELAPPTYFGLAFD